LILIYRWRLSPLRTAGPSRWRQVWYLQATAGPYRWRPSITKRAGPCRELPFPVRLQGPTVNLQSYHTVNIEDGRQGPAVRPRRLGTLGRPNIRNIAFCLLQLSNRGLPIPILEQWPTATILGALFTHQIFWTHGWDPCAFFRAIGRFLFWHQTWFKASLSLPHQPALHHRRAFPLIPYSPSL